MKEQNHPQIAPVKTRQQIQDEYQMTHKVFKKKLLYHKIDLPPGLITPKYQAEIYEAFGLPPL